MLVALSEIAFTALPLHMDVPVVLGRMRTLLMLNLLDTAASVILLVAASMVSIEWAAASRIGYGLVWYAVYAGFMRRLIGFGWGAMATIYLQSLACTVATVAPLLLAYRFVTTQQTISLPMLAAMALGGCLCWAAMLFVVRHPARLEFIDMAGALIGKLHPKPAR
jgi:hypothetical protein